MSAQRKLISEYGINNEYGRELLDDVRTEILVDFVKQLEEELSGCCSECDACVQLIRLIAAREV